MVSRIFQRYLWLVDILKRRGELTFGEIKEAWQYASINDEQTTLNERTFSNHCRAILDNFGIEIVCRRGRNKNRYYIANPEEFEENDLNHWLIENFSLNSLLAEHKDLSDKILIEDIPSSRDFLAVILLAIRQESVLIISYRNFVGRGFDNREFEPLCVKLFKRRWYVLVRSTETGEFRILSLDRIVNIELSSKYYTYPKDFFPKTFFAPYYGIIVLTDQSPVDIVLRAYEELPGYLHSLPMHHSQKMLQKGSDYIDFSLRLVPTFDFIQELLSHREQIEVLAPVSLRREMTDLLEKINNLYINVKA